jgi:hypothetical protein
LPDAGIGRPAIVPVSVVKVIRPGLGATEHRRGEQGAEPKQNAQTAKESDRDGVRIASGSGVGDLHSLRLGSLWVITEWWRLAFGFLIAAVSQDGFAVVCLCHGLWSQALRAALLLRPPTDPLLSPRRRTITRTTFVTDHDTD